MKKNKSLDKVEASPFALNGGDPHFPRIVLIPKSVAKKEQRAIFKRYASQEFKNRRVKEIRLPKAKKKN